MGRPIYIPRYTQADYDRWEGRWELIDGVAIAMSPTPEADHQRIVRRLLRLFDDQLGVKGCDECEVLPDLDWRIDDENVVAPDLSVMCGPRVERFIDRPPTLIVEVASPSTSIKDRNTKRSIYTDQGVRWYLLVDPKRREAKLLDLSIDPEAVDIDDQAVAPAADGTFTVDLHDGCRLMIDPAAIWP